MWLWKKMGGGVFSMTECILWKKELEASTWKCGNKAKGIKQSVSNVFSLHTHLKAYSLFSFLIQKSWCNFIRFNFACLVSYKKLMKQYGHSAASLCSEQESSGTCFFFFWWSLTWIKFTNSVLSTFFKGDHTQFWYYYFQNTSSSVHLDEKICHYSVTDLMDNGLKERSTCRSYIWYQSYGVGIRINGNVPFMKGSETNSSRKKSQSWSWK